MNTPKIVSFGLLVIILMIMSLINDIMSFMHSELNRKYESGYCITIRCLEKYEFNFIYHSNDLNETKYYSPIMKNREYWTSVS